MSAFDDLLLLHLRLDALAGGKVEDSSSHARHGQVTGRPAVVPDDEFGASVGFGGTDAVSVLSVAPGAGGGNPAHSITGWVRLDAYPTRRAWVLLFGQAGAGAHHWLVDPNGRTQLGVWNAGAAQPTLPLGRWVHVATTYDGTSLRCYLDGEPVGGPIATRFNYTSWGFTLARAQLNEAGFVGRLAGVRVYGRDLAAGDVAAIIADDRSAMAAFRRSHPLSFSLHDSDDQAVLAIVDDPTGNTMHLTVTNDASQPITLAAVDPADDGYHLELRLRPGTLPEGSVDAITMTGPAGWRLRTESTPDGTVAFALSSAAALTLAAGESLRFTLHDIGADPTGGTRGTRVQLRYAAMSYPDEPSALLGRRVAHLNIVNRRGQQHIPLVAGFVGGNTVIADGTTSSPLRLRIANVSADPIPLTPSTLAKPSAFVLAFDVQQTGVPASDWAIGTADALRGLTVTAPGWTVGDPTEQGQTMAWRLTTPTQIALAAGREVVVDIGGLRASPPSGAANLYVHYENMPGYWDGHLAVTVDKGPLVCRDVTLPDGGQDARVGIGTADPQAKLQVTGGAIMPAAGKTAAAGILFPSDPGGGAGDSAWIRYYARRGEYTTLEIGVSNDSNDHIALMTGSGNIGVNTTEPVGRLHVMNSSQDANGNTVIIGPTSGTNLRLGHHDRYSWVQAHGGTPLALNPVANDVAIGGTDPQGHRLFVNGTTKVLGLSVNSGHRFNRVQAGHFLAGPHGGTGMREFQLRFPEKFDGVPQAVVTPRNGDSFQDIFAVTVRRIDAETLSLNVLRLDVLGGAWTLDLWLDWIAWE
ncbi:LamG domain-containing protein [Actinophytocola oryzae]|uniref:Concanavalin A-like lectin/glucanase superfamily protein n=1 Tax=Actinophytocola oryzae TaxID=502181 RepID=A0A4R7W254_9PSEU|nr:LamG domain-containing protein [Actinophytocola oryzae]TDV55949.1 concanavalin A-like lectin/glucanase superfamily protein [Actinophytocola oryzae]